MRLLAAPEISPRRESDVAAQLVDLPDPLERDGAQPGDREVVAEADERRVGVVEGESLIVGEAAGEDLKMMRRGG